MLHLVTEARVVDLFSHHRYTYLEHPCVNVGYQPDFRGSPSNVIQDPFLPTGSVLLLLFLPLSLSLSEDRSDPKRVWSMGPKSPEKKTSTLACIVLPDKVTVWAHGIPKSSSNKAMPTSTFHCWQTSFMSAEFMMLARRSMALLRLAHGNRLANSCLVERQ